MSTSDFLHRYFEPVALALTPRSAQAILAARPDEADIARVEELGRKASEGTLTDEERDEYKSYVDAGELISILKAKARLALASEGQQ